MRGDERLMRRKARWLVEFLRKNAAHWIHLRDSLIKNGPESIPLYLAALDECGPDEQNGEHFSNPYEDLLAALAALHAVELIPKVLRDFSRAIRPQELARAVALLGHDQSIAPCIAWLDSANEDVRRCTIEGCARAAHSAHASSGFRQSMFSALARYVTSRAEMPLAKETFSTLLALDQDAALQVLRNAEHLRQDNPNLPDLLRVFSRTGIAVDPTVLHDFYRNAVAAETRYECGTPERINAKWICEACLTILADTAPELVIADLETALSSNTKGLRCVAVELLIKVEGLIPIYRNYTRDEYAQWPPEQKRVADLAGMLLQIESNGLDALWVNYDPLYYRVLFVHLQEIGAHDSAQLLLDVARLLGVDDPAIEQWPRDRGLPFSDAICEQIQQLAAATPELDRIEVLLLHYMRRNRESCTRSDFELRDTQ